MTVHATLFSFQPAQHAEMLCSADVTYFRLLLDGPLDTNYLKMYSTYLHQILRICTQGCSLFKINPTVRPSFCDRSRNLAILTDF